DPMFRSAARSYGPRVVGVVLSGTLDDGVAGLAAVKARGGVAVVQDPEDALYDGMPRAAIETVAVDEILPISEIGPTLARLSHEPVKWGKKGVSEEVEYEVEMAELDLD